MTDFHDDIQPYDPDDHLLLEKVMKADPARRITLTESFSDPSVADAFMLLVEDSDTQRVLKDIAETLVKLERIAAVDADLGLTHNYIDLGALLASGPNQYKPEKSMYPNAILWRFYESRLRKSIVERGSPV